ncbi:S-adenosyl-L-methionine-dependent methyltransferase [Artemisia annua]|uniref:Methyltransferase n=1 Tax=Artemisia annua TaxID=35608 RepID=A0A2U1KAH7_ARTAN|nr:S-adenosyl-L-methionine-dependent methyltransferase [Artemisia annua]
METLVKSCDREDLDTLWKLVQLDFKTARKADFALERGVPSFIGVLGSIKLPFPARSFDMAQCSRRLIPWGENDGTYLMEVDRVLRPGGFWILSGPPINWKTYYQTWKRSKEEHERNI